MNSSWLASALADFEAVADQGALRHNAINGDSFVALALPRKPATKTFCPWTPRQPILIAKLFAEPGSGVQSSSHRNSARCASNRLETLHSFCQREQEQKQEQRRDQDQLIMDL